MLQSTMDRAAVVYLANGRMIVAPMVRTTTGLGLETNPELMAAPVSEADLAAKLEQALKASAQLVPHPAQTAWKDFFQPFLTAAEVRSHKAFMKGAQRISVEERDVDLKITPHRNLGAKEGFEPISDEIEIIPSKDLTMAAEMVLKALKLA